MFEIKPKLEDARMSKDIIKNDNSPNRDLLIEMEVTLLPRTGAVL
jgi:hypothetical protein